MAKKQVRLWTIGYISEDPRESIIPTPDFMELVRKKIKDYIKNGEVDMIFPVGIDLKVFDLDFDEGEDVVQTKD